MLQWNNLSLLEEYHHYLAQVLPGQRFFFVGGTVRDLLLGRTTSLKDLDVTLGGQPQTIKNLIFQSGSSFSFFDTEKYGTMTIIPKDMFDGVQFELTPFRTETTYTDNRHPDEIQRSNSLIDDSQRRDFTINCLYYTRIEGVRQIKNVDSVDVDNKKTTQQFFKLLENQGYYYDPENQTLLLQDHDLIRQFEQDILPKEILSDAIHVVLDPHCGVSDLLAQKIKAVGNPDQRFQEDAVRLVRALRFAIALAFDIEKKTRTSLQKYAHLIRTIAKERIKQECDKVFAGNNPFGFVALLDSANMLKWIFPKVYDNKAVQQPIRYHPFDVYTHSMMVLYHLQQLSDDPILRYAALYHDVGKVEQYSSYLMKLDEDEVRSIFASWLNHTICGEEFVQEDFKALGASNATIATIGRYVRQHMKLGEILMADPQSYKKKLRPLLAEVGYEQLRNLALLTIADRLGQYNPLQKPAIEEVYQLITVMQELMDEEGRLTKSQLALNGNDIMQMTKIPAGPKIGDLIQRAYERVLEDPSRNTSESLTQFIKSIC